MTASDHEICLRLSAIAAEAMELSSLWRSLLSGGGEPPYHSLEEFQRRVPHVTKDLLFGRSRQQITDCLTGGDLSAVAEVISSSGSGRRTVGTSFLSDADVGRLRDAVDGYLDKAFDLSSLSTVVLSVLPGGVRIPTSKALSLHVGVRPDLALSMLERLGEQHAQVVIVAEPLFAKRLLEYLHERGYPLRQRRIHLVVGGYYLAENLRDYLAWLLGTRLDEKRKDPERILSTFGAGEVGLNLMNETPETVALRRHLRDKPRLVSRLCGDDLPTAPMFFIHDPDRVYIEVEDHRLLFTMLEPGRLQPVIRYDTGDWGGIVPAWKLREELPTNKLDLVPRDGADLIWNYGRRAAQFTSNALVTAPRLMEALFKPADKLLTDAPDLGADPERFADKDSATRTLASITGYFDFSRVREMALRTQERRWKLTIQLAPRREDGPHRAFHEYEEARQLDPLREEDLRPRIHGNLEDVFGTSPPKAPDKTPGGEGAEQQTRDAQQEAGSRQQGDGDGESAPIPTDPPTGDQAAARGEPRVEPSALFGHSVQVEFTAFRDYQKHDIELLHEAKPRFLRPSPVFRRALTERDKDRVYGLRHRVFVVEEGLDYSLLGADAGSRQIQDAADNGAAHFLAEIGGQVVGALRVVREYACFEDKRSFDFRRWVLRRREEESEQISSGGSPESPGMSRPDGKLAKVPELRQSVEGQAPPKYGAWFARSALAQVGRICIARSHRGERHRIVDGLMIKAIDYLLSHKVAAVFLDCASRWVPRYEGMGFIDYKPPYIHDGTGKRYHTLVAFLGTMAPIWKLLQEGTKDIWPDAWKEALDDLRDEPPSWLSDAGLLEEISERLDGKPQDTDKLTARLKDAAVLAWSCELERLRTKEPGTPLDVVVNLRRSRRQERESPPQAEREPGPREHDQEASGAGCPDLGGSDFQTDWSKATWEAGMATEAMGGFTREARISFTSEALRVAREQKRGLAWTLLRSLLRLRQSELKEQKEEEGKDWAPPPLDLPGQGEVAKLVEAASGPLRSRLLESDEGVSPIEQVYGQLFEEALNILRDKAATRSLAFTLERWLAYQQSLGLTSNTALPDELLRQRDEVHAKLLKRASIRSRLIGNPLGPLVEPLLSSQPAPLADQESGLDSLREPQTEEGIPAVPRPGAWQEFKPLKSITSAFPDAVEVEPAPEKPPKGPPSFEVCSSKDFVVYLAKGAVTVGGPPATGRDPITLTAGETLGAAPSLLDKRSSFQVRQASQEKLSLHRIPVTAFRKELKANIPLCMALTRQLIREQRQRGAPDDDWNDSLRFDDPDEILALKTGIDSSTFKYLTDGIEPSWRVAGSALCLRGSFADHVWLIDWGTVYLLRDRCLPPVAREVALWADKQKAKWILDCGARQLVGCWGALMPLDDPAMTRARASSSTTPESTSRRVVDEGALWESLPVRGAAEGEARRGPQPERHDVTAIVGHNNTVVYELEREEFIRRLERNREAMFAVCLEVCAGLVRHAAQRQINRRPTQAPPGAPGGNGSPDDGASSA